MDNVSVYNGVKDNRGVVVSVSAVLNRIKNGSRELDEKTRIASVLYHTDKEAYTREKMKLPAVTWSGSFTRRKASDLVQHSGLICLDFDDIDVGGLLAKLAGDPHVFFAFVSPSGAGVKCIVPFSPKIKNAEEHKIAFAAVKEHFDQYGEIDESGSDVSRLCFLAYYPQAIQKTDAKALTGSLAPALHCAEQYEGAKKSTRKASNTAAEHILSFINPLALDYETWRNVGMALKDAGLPLSIWVEWCGGQRTRSTGEVVTEDCAAHWKRYNARGITFASVVHLAKENGYIPNSRLALGYYDALQRVREVMSDEK